MKNPRGQLSGGKLALIQFPIIGDVYKACIEVVIETDRTPASIDTNELRRQFCHLIENELNPRERTTDEGKVYEPDTIDVGRMDPRSVEALPGIIVRIVRRGMLVE
ncbi:MAG: hypothetical protein QOG12_1750 [Verrucomicrobiota bacterium]|jgi:hypothetical protein